MSRGKKDILEAPLRQFELYEVSYSPEERTLVHSLEAQLAEDRTPAQMHTIYGNLQKDTVFKSLMNRFTDSVETQISRHEESASSTLMALNRLLSGPDLV